MDQFNSTPENPQNTNSEAAPSAAPQYAQPQSQYVPPQYTAPQYTPPQYQYTPPQSPVSVYVAPQTEEEVGVGSWFGVFILEAIPLVNLILYIVWACGGTRKPSLRKYAIARLIFWPIIIVAVAIIVAAMGGLGALMMQLSR